MSKLTHGALGSSMPVMLSSGLNRPGEHCLVLLLYLLEQHVIVPLLLKKAHDKSDEICAEHLSSWPAHLWHAQPGSRCHWKRGNWHK